MRIIISILALVLFLPFLAAGAPDEAYGRVSKVVEGDTFDVTLQDYNSSQVSEDVAGSDLQILTHQRFAAPEPAKLEEMHQHIPEHGY